MKETTFFLVVGIIAATSLTCGFLGLHFAKVREEKQKHNEPSTFKDVFEDNSPSDDIPSDDLSLDFTPEFLNYY